MHSDSSTRRNINQEKTRAETLERKLDWKGGEFTSTEETTVASMKKGRDKVKIGERDDGEPVHQTHLFSATLYLAAHTSPLHWPVFTAINLGVAFWPASPA